MPFGYLLKRFRLEKGLTLRQLGDEAQIDHAYINRLETREKETPSEQVVERLVRALELGDREAWLLGFVGRFRLYVDIGMIEFVLKDPAITREEFSWAVALKFREPELDDYTALFDCARQIIKLVKDFRGKGKSKSAGAS